MRLLIILLLFSLPQFPSAQNNSVDLKEIGKSSEVYKIDERGSTILCAGLAITDFYGHRIHRKKDAIPLSELMALDQANVNSLDRKIFHFDSGFRDEAIALSDYGLYGSALLPLLLFTDKEIRSDWMGVTLLFFKSQLIGTNIYTWGGPMLQDRFRPITYYQDVPQIDRAKNSNRNSFFSGHVSTTATGCFFVAKVYCDYHLELGIKKYLFFAAAAVPTVAVAYYRMRALKHFPTDVILGSLVGATAGILIPHWHKKRASQNLSGSFFYDQRGSGLVMSLKF